MSEVLDEDEKEDLERTAGTENVADSNIFFYVMLTLVFLLSVLAIVLAIVAYVKASGQLVGPQGPQGPAGEIPVAQLFEQPATYVSDLVYPMNNDPNMQKRFLVFIGQPENPATMINVTLPLASAYSGKIIRIYNVYATAGVLLRAATGDSEPIPHVFNPILPGYFAMVISDGASQWVINSSTVVEVPASGGTGS